MNVSPHIKKKILSTAYNANKGHLGSALSVSDLVLLAVQKSISDNKYELVLSKGHAALAFYCVLNEFGFISDKELSSYCSEKTLFGTHPDPAMPMVEFIGGSLGQGISFAVGKAIAYKNQGKEKKIIVILSDSELNSGVFWEVLALSSTHKLDNLIVLLDNNGQQALGLSENVINYPDIEETVKTLGWEAGRIDGHDVIRIDEEIVKISNKPRFVVADTKFGGGVSFMEGKIEWHYLPLTDELYKQAINDIENLTA